MTFMDRVKKLPFDDSGKHFLCLSYRRSADQKESCFALAVVSFVSLGERIAIEWCPPYGPVTVITKAEAGQPDVKEHYLFPWVQDNPCDCSQTAVGESGLEEAACESNWNRIFYVLDDWLQYRERELAEAETPETSGIL